MLVFDEVIGLYFVCFVRPKNAVCGIRFSLLESAAKSLEIDVHKSALPRRRSLIAE